MPARMLIIEDNAANLDLMVYLLQAFGFETMSATTGEEGLACLRRSRADLVLCDVHLPAMDGYEVARTLKSDPSSRHLPVIAVTALAMVGDREKALSAGFDGYISKPINPETFVASLAPYLPPGATPTAKISPAPAFDPSVPAPAKKCAILLLVDDSAPDLALMESLFNPSGYETVVSRTVAGALALARGHQPDLIICDVNMPGGSGFDLINALKADHTLHGLPVILVTATAMSVTDRERGLALGARRFLTRPIEPQTLLDEVAACLREVEDS